MHNTPVALAKGVLSVRRCMRVMQRAGSQVGSTVPAAIMRNAVRLGTKK